MSDVIKHLRRAVGRVRTRSVLGVASDSIPTFFKYFLAYNIVSLLEVERGVGYAKTRFEKGSCTRLPGDAEDVSPKVRNCHGRQIIGSSVGGGT